MNIIDCTKITSIKNFPPKLAARGGKLPRCYTTGFDRDYSGNFVLVEAIATSL